MDVHWENGCSNFPSLFLCPRLLLLQQGQLSNLGCTKDSSKSCRAAALGQPGGVSLEPLSGIAVLAVFEGSGQCSTKEVSNVESLVNTLSHICHAEMVNTWNNENFG